MGYYNEHEGGEKGIKENFKQKISPPTCAWAPHKKTLCHILL